MQEQRRGEMQLQEQRRGEMRLQEQRRGELLHLRSINLPKPPVEKDALRSAMFCSVQKKVMKRGACANMPRKLLSGCTSCLLNSSRSFSVCASVATGLENMLGRGGEGGGGVRWQRGGRCRLGGG